MLECPYCHEDVEPNENHSQDITHEATCPHCEKNFVYTVEYYPSYSASPAPCLNGGEHDYQPIVGWPEEYFAGKRRCSFCQAEVQVAG